MLWGSQCCRIELHFLCALNTNTRHFAIFREFCSHLIKYTLYCVFQSCIHFSWLLKYIFKGYEGWHHRNLNTFWSLLGNLNFFKDSFFPIWLFFIIHLYENFIQKCKCEWNKWKMYDNFFFQIKISEGNQMF